MPKSALDLQEGGDHYKKYKIQPMEFFHKNSIPVLESGIMKYVIRHKDKNGYEDLLKARHLINVLLELEYGYKDIEQTELPLNVPENT